MFMLRYNQNKNIFFEFNMWQVTCLQPEKSKKISQFRHNFRCCTHFAPSSNKLSNYLRKKIASVEIWGYKGIKSNINQIIQQFLQVNGATLYFWALSYALCNETFILDFWLLLFGCDFLSHHRQMSCFSWVLKVIGNMLQEGEHGVEDHLDCRFIRFLEPIQLEIKLL